MSAYVIADISVNDLERYEDYKKLAPPAIAAYGGKYVARGGKAEKLEGDWEPGRVVILEFESVEKAKQNNYINIVNLKFNFLHYQKVLLDFGWS